MALGSSQEAVLSLCLLSCPAILQAPAFVLRFPHELEKEMPTPLNLHTWKIPWAEEPGGLQSVGSQRVEHDGVTKQHDTPRTPLVSVLLSHRSALCAEEGGEKAELQACPELPSTSASCLHWRVCVCVCMSVCVVVRWEGGGGDLNFPFGPT